MPRQIFLAALVIAMLSLGAFAGLQSAERFEMRGRDHGFPQPVFGAGDLTLGVNIALESADVRTLDAMFQLLKTRGVRVVRQEFRWADIERIRGQFDWTASDRLIAAAKKQGIRVLPVLWTTPVWARGPSGSAQNPAIETAPPAAPEDFGAFAAAFAERYDGSGADSVIHAYQIWDEPNLSSAWGNALINPIAYLQMLRTARDRIRRVNPSAVIVLAALAPTVEQSNVNLAPQTYLLKLYQLGGHEAFDVASAKPYGFAFSPEDRRVDPDVLNFSHLLLLREVMLAHGDGHKAIWAAQFGWNALPAGWRGEVSLWGSVSETQQAEFTQVAVRRAAREWPWLGALYIEGLAPRPRKLNPEADPRWGFALIDQSGVPRPLFDAVQAAQSDAQHAPRANLFANCMAQQSLARTLRLENLITAMPEVLAATPDCGASNPRAVFTEGWRFDQLGADIPERPDANVRVRFSGDAFGLIVRRGNYRAYTYVTIDGQPANLLPRDARGAYLIMTSPGLYPVIETLPVADMLGPGEHVAEITVDRGWNQWALIGWSTRAESDLPSYSLGRWLSVLIGFFAALTAVWVWPRTRWPALLPVLTRSRSRGLAILSGLGLWLAASFTWAQDAATAWRNLGLPVTTMIGGAASGLLFWSPVFVMSLILLAVLFVLILTRLDIGLLLAAFFIPFFLLPQRIFARSFPMIEILTIMCVASLALQLVRAARAGQIQRTTLSLRALNLLDWGVLAFALVAIASTMQAQQQVEAWRELRLVIIEPLLLYAVIRAARLDHDTHKHVLTAFVVGAIVVACIGLFNYAQGDRFIAEGGLPRIKSIFNSANNDALYLARALPFALMGLLAAWQTRTHALYLGWRLAGLTALCLALLLTQSRGALLFGVPAMLVCMLMLAGGRWRWLGLAVLLLVMLGFGALVSGILTPYVQGTRLASAFDLTRGTGFFRLNLWQSAWQMFLDHPVLGVGPDNFLYAYRSFYILPAAWQEPNLSHPHNVLFDWLTRLGALGLAAALTMLLGVMRFIRRGLRDTMTRGVAIAVAGYLAVVFAHGLVDHSFFLPDLMFGFMLVAALLVRSVLGQTLDAHAG